MSGFTLETLTVRIEQALARGRSVEWMRRMLGATPAEIANARAHLEEAVADDQWVQRQKAGIA